MEDQDERPIGNHNALRAMEGGDELDDQPVMYNTEQTDEMMPITIHSLDFGYNVKIGCQNFAVETVGKLIKNLEAYLNDSSGTEKKWTKDKKLL